MKFQVKILVIEDDQNLAKSLSIVLAMQNYEVCVANNGAHGIQKAFECNPDLILCDINMDQIDGYQVYNILKESSLVDHIPFIFITGNSDLEDIRFGMDLGADDYFVKPINVEHLVRAIQKRINKFKKLEEIGRREFNTLFQMNPNGIFLFDGQVIFDANPSFLRMLGNENETFTSSSLENIIAPASYQSISEKINRCSKGILDSFSEKVFLKSTEESYIEVKLFVSVYTKFSGYPMMIGLIANNLIFDDDNEDYISSILKVLKKENIIISESLGKRLSEIFNHQNGATLRQVDGFFSKREAEILSLSMNGLPMKIIADKLSISSRTVEKHRANLMEKTKSKNMIEVIVFALRNNLVEI